MVISEIIIAVLLGVLVIVSAIYLTYFLWNNYKLAKQRAENGDDFEEDNKKSKVLSIILVAYLALAASIFAINLFYRSSPLIKNQYFVSIKTDSMSQALKENYYLDNNKLTNQIAQYDIAVFDKTEENDIQKYDIILFKNFIGPNVKMKAAGGIRTLEDAQDYLNLGCDRLGTSAIVKIIKEQETKWAEHLLLF